MLLPYSSGVGNKRQFFGVFLFLPEEWNSSLDRKSSRYLLWETGGGENNRQQELHVQGPVVAGSASENQRPVSVGGQQEGCSMAWDELGKIESHHQTSRKLFGFIPRATETYQGFNGAGYLGAGRGNHHRIATALETPVRTAEPSPLSIPDVETARDNEMIIVLSQ